MKRIFLVMLLVIAFSTLLLGACSNASPAPTTAAPTTSAPASTSSPSPSQVQSSPSVKPVELKMIFHFTPQGTPAKSILIPWAEKIEQETGGKVKITAYPGATLVKQQDEYEAVESGLADIACFVPAPGRFPLSEVVSLPKMFPNCEISARVYNELLIKYAADTELKNVKLLWVVGFPQLELISKKPVQKIEDFKGMKLWASSKLEGWITEQIGATGSFMETADVLNSLDRGLLDGMFFSWEGAFAMGFYQVASYRTQTDMFTRAYPLVMNMDRWNSLPQDVRDVFTKNSGPLVSAEYGKIFDKVEPILRQKIADADKAAGKPGIYFLSAEENTRWQEALKPVWAKWVDELKGKNLPAQAMVDDAVKLTAQYSTEATVAAK